MPTDHLFGQISTRSVLIVGGISALFLRLLLLGSKSFWLDEANSLRVADIGQNALWAGRSEIYHPPFFYAFVHWWAQFGHSEFFLRLPSALLGTVSVLLLFWLASMLFDEEVAKTALWLATLSPLLIWYSQEFRSYAFVGVLVLGSVLSLVAFLRRTHWLYLVLFAFSTLAAIYTHYSAFLLLPLQLILLVALSGTRRNVMLGLLWWSAVWLLIIIGYWPWLSSPPAARFVDLLLGNNSYVSQLIKARAGISYTEILFLLTLLFLSGVAVFKWLIRPQSISSPERLRGRLWVQLSFAALFILLLLLDVIPRGYSLKRQLSLVWPFLLLGFAWVWPWGKAQKKLLVTVLIFSALAALVNIAVIPKDEWRQVAAHVAAQKEATDVVVLQPGYMSIPFDFYDAGATTSVSFDDEKIGNLLIEDKRIWLIVHTRDVADVNRSVERWFKTNATALEQTQFYNLTVTLYGR